MRKFRDTLPKEVAGLHDTNDLTREKRIHGERQPQPLFARVLFIALISLVAMIFVGCGNQVSGTGGKDGSSQSSGQKKTQSAKKEQASEAGGKLEHPALGDKNAPLVMVEYGDYQ